MTPWSRRLGDMKQLIWQAEQTYFEPDLFRLNVNNAIQTSRTVTFLIQKNKYAIEGFDEWYRTHVLEPCAADPIMVWLKDSRNQIEKEGDLELNSQCELEAIFSYTDDGPRLSLKQNRMLFASIKYITRHMKDVFPAGVFKDSAIAIERRWVAKTLPEFELIEALQHGYRILARAAEALDAKVGQKVEQGARVGRYRAIGESRRVYLKTADGNVYIQTRSPFRLDSVDKSTLAKKHDFEKVRAAFASTKDPNEAIERFADTAMQMFLKDGYHITIGFLLNDQGDVLEIIAPQFDDHSDKLIFWNDLGRTAVHRPEIDGVIFISEAWMRSTEGFPEKRISDLKVTGEVLQVVVATRSSCLIKSIPILRTDQQVRLDVGEAEVAHWEPNFLAPLRRAWAINGRN